MIRSLLPAVLLLLPLGCGVTESTGTISGKVSLAGKPLKGGSISFLPSKADAIPLTTIINEDGSFEIKDVPYGDLLVSVSPPIMAGGASITSASSAKERMGELERTGQPIPRELIEAAGGGGDANAAPAGFNSKYSDPFTSGITYTLDQPAATKDFDLP
jgi:hypothetical protein